MLRSGRLLCHYGLSRTFATNTRPGFHRTSYYASPLPFRKHSQQSVSNEAAPINPLTQSWPPSEPKHSRLNLFLLAGIPIAILCSLAVTDPATWPIVGPLHIWARPTASDAPLHLHEFRKFSQVDRENLSETSMILTLTPNDPSPCAGSNEGYAKYWNKGIWSVEIKQPQINISRRYTPLPPLMQPDSPLLDTTINTTTPPEPPQHSDSPSQHLRLLIRRESSGEMSNYLHRLSPSTPLELRGGYAEFEIPADVQEVLFLAGGTGIAPALQVAHTLDLRCRGDEDMSARMRVLWANRTRDECHGASGGTSRSDSETDPRNSLVKHLETFQKTTSGLQCGADVFVDAEGTFIRQGEVSRALDTFTNLNNIQIKPSAATTTTSGSNSNATTAARKLILISGPDGFVEYLAGPKMYHQGKVYPGVTGGVLAQVKLDNWQVYRL